MILNVLDETPEPGNKFWPPCRKRESVASVLPQADLCDSPDNQILFWVLRFSHRISLGSDVSLQPGKACELPHKVFVFPLSTLACVCFVIGSLIGGRT